MGQSLVKNYVHIVFGTKNGTKNIDDQLETELFKYLGGICNKLEFQVIKAGGHKDHVHILCQLSKKIALVQLVEKLKSKSSKWVKTKGLKYSKFYWQSGYGTFSVNPSEVDIVVNYIANQKEHHAKKTFNPALFMKILRN